MDGRRFRLTSSRSLVLDIAHFAKKVPTFPVERWFDLSDVATARSEAMPRISWVALFIKAYGLVSRHIPQLRTQYVPYPIPHFYESRQSVISVSINRLHEGQDRLFWGKFAGPEHMRLLDVQYLLNHYCTGDVTVDFKRQIRASRLPMLLRRAIWWWQLNLEPSKRARRLGTASISVLAGQGVYNRLHPCLLSSTLAYGPIQPDGRMWVTLQCDHRVLDGVAAAGALNLFETVLKRELLSELSLLKLNQSQAA